MLRSAKLPQVGELLVFSLAQERGAGYVASLHIVPVASLHIVPVIPLS